MRTRPTTDDRAPMWTTFLSLHAAAVVLDATEKWHDPPVTLTLVVLAGALLVAPPATRRWLDPAWFAVSIAALLPGAPDLANHRNLTLYIDLVVLAGWLGACLRARRWTACDDALLARLAPVLRASAAVVYFFAGFHKLNTDFLLQPEVSCAGWFADKLGHLYLGGPLPLSPTGVMALAAITVVWELALAVALPLSRGRGRVVALAAAWALHAVLAMAVFFDFSALMLALLWTFVPHQALDADLERRRRVYLGAALASGLISGAVLALHGPPIVGHVVQGATVVVAGTWLLLPVWLTMWSRQARSAAGPRGLAWWLAPALLALFASSNYLGLRTGGTFSMFSNLRTEGGVTNHLLVPADHPLELSGVQDDLVVVESLEPDLGGRPELHGEPLSGRSLPRAELDRIVERWRIAGHGPVRAVLHADGRRRVVNDLTDPAQWPLHSHPIARWTLDFRPVQTDPTAPNACRW